MVSLPGPWCRHPRGPVASAEAGSGAVRKESDLEESNESESRLGSAPHGSRDLPGPLFPHWKNGHSFSTSWVAGGTKEIMLIKSCAQVRLLEVEEVQVSWKRLEPSGGGGPALGLEACDGKRRLSVMLRRDIVS